MSSLVRYGLCAVLLTSCVHSDKNHGRQPSSEDDMVEQNLEINKSVYYHAKRGSPAEYDAGPSKNSKWPDLFAETPNYRAYGKAIYEAAAKKAGIYDDGQEKFRWKVGPMWYRGRLAPESVKIFVVGQEGAQDENVSNRTFTGSTGTKMQNFINYFGVNKSYLFMNTFAYTITGQYGERVEPTDTPEVKKAKEVRTQTLYWLAQNPDSVIVKHRHKMFDYMLSQNQKTLRLVIGVGSAGKDSVVTWIKTHGGDCTVQKLSNSYCDADVIAPGVKAIGLMHPGAASQKNGGSDAANSLRAQFARRADVVAQLMQKNSDWLVADEGAQADFNKEFDYRDAAIPYRDFAFGTNWRMGNDGTSTNRRGADGIQIFSAKGCYNNAARLENGRCDFNADPALIKKIYLNYDEPQDIDSDFKMAEGDVPYESPKSPEGRRDYDRGPGRFANIFMGLTAGGWPDFNSLGVTQDNSFGFGSVYRGNPHNPEIVILADQESHDDMFSTRALTGTGGQQLQSYLKLIGAKQNYLILRTLPVDTLDLSKSVLKKVVLNEQVVNVRNSILDAVLKQNKTKVFVTIGDYAKMSLQKYNLPTGIKVFHLIDSRNKYHIKQWQTQIDDIAQALTGGAALGAYQGKLTAIPRADLPVHTRWWMGTSGSRAYRAYTRDAAGVRKFNGDYYQFQAPTWVDYKQYPARSSEIYNKPTFDNNEYINSLNLFNSTMKFYQ